MEGIDTKLKNAQIAGFIFTVVFGTALHFVYEWSGGNPIVGVVGPVNESVWEHMKLQLVPMLIFGIVEYFLYGKKLPNFIQVRFLSILLGMALTIVVFYTYSGIIGREFLIVDILLFIASVYVAYRFSYKMLQTDKYSSPSSKGLAIIGIIVLLICVVIFTFAPPHINLFLDPSTGTYGIPLK